MNFVEQVFNCFVLQVAVKEAREIIGNLDADIYQEFLLEAHTIHELKHENITSLYGVSLLGLKCQTLDMIKTVLLLLWFFYQIFQ